MRSTGVFWILAVLVGLCCQSARGAEPALTDAAQFLKQTGLEDMHATYAKYFTLLSEKKTEAASQQLLDSFPPNMNNSALERLRQMTTDFQTVFSRGVEDVELVGVLPISGKSVALYYMVNGRGGPVAVVLVPFRWEGKWRTHSGFFSSEMSQVIQHLKGISRFSKGLVVPLKSGRTA